MYKVLSKTVNRKFEIGFLFTSIRYINMRGYTS